MWYKNKIVAPDGNEVVYELTTPEESPTRGIALADITRSVMHWHEVLTETYVLLSGGLIIKTIANGRLQQIVLTQSLESFVIEPHVIHSAEGMDGKPARILALSTPHWTPEDHFIYKK